MKFFVGRWANEYNMEGKIYEEENPGKLFKWNLNKSRKKTKCYAIKIFNQEDIVSSKNVNIRWKVLFMGSWYGHADEDILVDTGLYPYKRMFAYEQIPCRDIVRLRCRYSCCFRGIPVVLEVSKYRVVLKVSQLFWKWEL